MWSWVILLLSGGILLGGGYVVGCSQGQKMTQVTDVDTTSTQDTQVKTTVMQGQVTILFNGDAGQLEFINLNFNDLSNMIISHSNFIKMTVTNGLTNVISNIILNQRAPPSLKPR